MAILFLSFAAVLAYNLLTPMITDDFTFASQARKAGSFGGLILQQYQEYMTWTGRILPHFLTRWFFTLPMTLFKILNSVMFSLLSVIIYLNIEGRNKWDPWIMLLSQLGLWIFAVDFADTVLWETGAFNYLWAVTLIFGFMTLERYFYKKPFEKRITSVPVILLLFILGVSAGSSSENTSGGCLLYLLILLGSNLSSKRKPGLYLSAGLLGNITGLILMVKAPGNSVRYNAKLSQEAHDGLYGMFSRLQKVTLSIRDCMFLLLVILVATLVVTALQNRHSSRKNILMACRSRLVFTFLAFMTSYALILTPEPQNRAYFGAGIFLLTACIQGIQDITVKERTEDDSILIRTAVYISTAVLLLFFFFRYVDCGANLARVYRDEEERESYIEEQRSQGVTDVTVAQLHPDFDNHYTIIYEADLTDDPAYWVNVMYAEYFGVDSVKAIPYEEWKKQYGG